MSWQQCPHCVAGTCVYATENRRFRRSNRGHRFYKAPKKWWQVVSKELSMKKPESIVKGSPDGKAEPCDMACRFENLFAFMSDTAWDDGSKRAPGTILMMFEDGQWKVMMNDKALGRLAFVTGRTWEEVLIKAELNARDDSLDWRKAKVWKK